MARIGILGGGVAGLTAAYRLQKAAPAHTLFLFEKERKFGGKIRTWESGGFLFEEGPDSFLTRKPAAVRLSRELDIDDRLIGRSPQPKGSFILHAGRLHPLPEGFSGLVPSDPAALFQSGLLSETGIRRLQEAVLDGPPENEDVSVEDYFVRRYGLEAFRVMIEPLASGIFAGNARRLSLRAAFPHLAAQKTVGGSTAVPKGKGETGGSDSYPDLPSFVSYADGMQRLPEALQARVDPGSLHPATRVGAVRRTGGRYLLELSSGGSAEVDALILALPPIAVAEVTEPLSQSLAGAHAEIEAASTVVVNVGYRASDLPGRLEGYGYLSPMADGRHFHGCTWSSNKWPGRAPEGFVALRLYGGRFGERELFDSDVSEILRHAAEELREVLGIDAKPVVSRVTRWAEAIPQYNLGYSSVLNRIESALNDLPGVFLAGAAYGGVGIPDCVRSGETAAEGAIAYLQEGRNTR